jgi:hypothetical protein
MHSLKNQFSHGNHTGGSSTVVLTVVNAAVLHSGHETYASTRSMQPQTNLATANILATMSYHYKHTIHQSVESHR